MQDGVIKINRNKSQYKLSSSVVSENLGTASIAFTVLRFARTTKRFF